MPFATGCCPSLVKLPRSASHGGPAGTHGLYRKYSGLGRRAAIVHREYSLRKNPLEGDTVVTINGSHGTGAEHSRDLLSERSAATIRIRTNIFLGILSTNAQIYPFNGKSLAGIYLIHQEGPYHILYFRRALHKITNHSEELVWSRVGFWSPFYTRL